MFKQLRVGQGQKGKGSGIFFVGFRGVVSRDELEEPVDYFWVDDVGIDIVGEEEVIEGDVESSGGFHHNDYLRQGFKEFEEVGETFRRHGMVTRGEGFSLLIKDREMEVFLGDVNTDKMFHNTTSLNRDFLVPHTILPCGRGSIGPTNLLGVEGQRDRLPSGLKSP